MSNIKMKGSDILKQEITSHDEAVALMQQGSVLMVVGWWAKAKAIEYLVKESGLSFREWHVKNCLQLPALSGMMKESQRQQSWQEVKWLDDHGVEENDLPKVENHAYRLRKIDESDRLATWRRFKETKTPWWSKASTKRKYDRDHDYDGEFKDTERKTNLREVFSLSKILIEENQAMVADKIIEYMLNGNALKQRAIKAVLKKYCDGK